MSKRSARLMAKAFLHSSRRTALNTQGEPILLTSFYWRRRGPVTILWSEVRGAVTIKSFESITAKNLRSVWGYFYSSTEEEVNLHNLKYVGGDFDIRSLQLRVRNLAVVGGSLMVCEPDLPNLESIGKRFWVSWASELRVPNLRYVAGSLEVEGAESVFLPALQWVGFDLKVCYLTTVFSAPMLEAVGGTLEARSAKVFHAARLESVGDALYTESAMDYYQPDFDDGSLHWEMHPDARTRWLLRERVRHALGAQHPLDI